MDMPFIKTPLRAAVRALAASGLAVGVTGAGVVGSCNPANAGYRPLFAAAANGSWLGIVPGEVQAHCASKRLPVRGTSSAKRS